MWLFGAAVMLLSAGVVMVYSASAIVAADRFHDPYFFLKKQLFWALLGSIAMLVAVRVDYRKLERFVLPALIVAGVLLLLVLIPPIGRAINGTRRWWPAGSAGSAPEPAARRPRSAPAARSARASDSPRGPRRASRWSRATPRRAAS